MASVLRSKFENHLILNRLSASTQEAYINAVRGISRHYKRSPDTLSNEQVQDYLIFLLKGKRLSWSSCNVAFSGLYCFYAKFLKRPKTEFCIPSRPRQRKLPEILSTKEVLRLFEYARDIRQRALLMMTYGSGLRVSEVVRLQSHHIETDRKLVRVEQGKGRKDRYTLLSQKALEQMRIYYQKYTPKRYLFYCKDRNEPMSISTAQKIYKRCKQAAGLNKGRGIHTLRHCFATHLLEQGIDIYLIKRFLGHASIQTTMVYLHVLPDRMAEVRSPLDHI